MIELPNQLKSKKIRFVKIDSGTKRPIEESWAEDNNYRYNENEFKIYLKQAESYGIVCGYGNLIIVDIENIEDKSVANLVFTKFPKTFTVQTGNGGWHLYYFCPEIKKRIRLTKKGRHYGEIQAKGNQCIGPGSIHPSGNKYTILNNTEIETISKKNLIEILDGFTEEKDISKFKINTIGGMNWDISKLIKYCPGLKSRDDIKWRGAHPIHGSETGQNFEIDVEKNTWYCFRCEVGGDAVSLIAMLEGIVKIDDYCPTKDQIKKEFKSIKKIGIEKYGYPDNNYDSGDKQRPTGPESPNDFKLFIKKGKKEKLNVFGISNYIDSKKTFIAIEDATGRATHIYAYEDGYYKLNGESILRVLIKELFKTENIPWSTYYENEIVNYIKTRKTIKRDEIQEKPHLINLNNGIYNLFTKRLEKHSPKYYFLYKIPWNYNSKAKLTKEMIKYFNTTFNKKKYINLTQELFGYCLYTKYNYHGLFYLYGTGGNGKTVWLRILENLLGTNNIANKSINSLISNRFVTAQLYGKLLNSCGELSGYVLENTDMLKRLTAGERIEAEFKGKDGFDFNNYAKIITACNSIPSSNDKTDGWYDRQYILPFLKKFRYTKEQDIDLIDKLITKKSMEGLLVWSIEGLKRLLTKKRFTYLQDKKEKYLMYQENTKYFVRTKYERDNNLNNYIKVNDIRKEYIKWCHANDIPVDSNEALSRAFRYFRLPSPQLISLNNKKVYVRYRLKKVN